MKIPAKFLAAAFVITLNSKCSVEKRFHGPDHNKLAKEYYGSDKEIEQVYYARMIRVNLKHASSHVAISELECY